MSDDSVGGVTAQKGGEGMESDLDGLTHCIHPVRLLKARERLN